MNDEEHFGGSDALLRRMQRADPARSSNVVDSPTPDLVEATMSTTPSTLSSRPRRWVPALAAAATLAVVGGGAVAFLGGDDPTGSPGSTETTLALPAGDGTSMNSCMMFDVEYLRQAPVAFSGSATEVGDGGVTLEVDRWYKGGDADVVRLTHDDQSMVSLDGFAFERGGRYLITATEGTVNTCGFSGPWNPELAAAFEEAFGS